MVSMLTTCSGSLRDRVLPGVWGTVSPRALPSRHSHLPHAFPLGQGKQGGPRLILMEKLRHRRLQAGFGPACTWVTWSSAKCCCDQETRA